MDLLSWIDCLVLLASSGLLLLFAVTSWREGEKRALWIAILLLPANALFWTLLIVFRHQAVLRTANAAILGLAAVFALFSLSKYFPLEAAAPDPGSIERFDERDHMFSRNQLKFHPQLAADYYGQKPHFRAGDEKLHARPELGQPGHAYDDPLHTPVFAAAFSYLERTRDAACGEVNPRRSAAALAGIRSAILGLARQYGAVDVGITQLRPYHFYSRSGRRADHWGEPIPVEGGSAVIVVVAMDWKMIAAAPTLPVILESARQYVEAAKIASIIAEYIRGLGYRARAHTDGNYQVLCVPLAVDAGLGELGRLGVLIHPLYGPCVRLAAVSTELELLPTPRRDFHMASFCRICKKCADNCPTRAIASGAEPASRGLRHWSIEQEKCFGFWKQVGSDCAVCIRSCPYTKPDTLLHRLVRFYVARNPLNQRLALIMDDLFYGRKKKISASNPVSIFRA
jgi:reductive dehalogenase